MRRSSSISHIPLFKPERTRSKSSIRTSGSAKKEVVASAEKRPSLKRSISSVSLKKPAATPTLQSLRPSTSKRSFNVNTPSSSRPSRSPYRIGSGKAEKNFNDKKWVSEQQAKVQQYIREHASLNLQERIPESLKPLTINLFVDIMNLLLKEIDNRIEVTLGNYKDVVLHQLKTIHYPGPISNSLLKCVNTLHSWPQIISIFGWLVDLITCIRHCSSTTELLYPDIKHQKLECVTDYVINRYNLYNDGQDESEADQIFVKQYETIFNVDDDEIEKLSQEAARLNLVKEKQKEDLRKREEMNDLLKKEIDNLEYEIDTYYEEYAQKDEEMDHVIQDLKETTSRLTTVINNKQENITKLNDIIRNQRCSLEEKIKLQTRISEMQHTLELEKDNLFVKKDIKTECNLKLTDAKKKVKTEIYRINKELMKFTVLETELKTLAFKEKDFTSENFGDEIKNVIKNKEIIEKKISDEISSKKAFIHQCVNDTQILNQQYNSIKKEIDVLTDQETEIDEQIRKYESEIEIMKKARENEANKIREEIAKMRETEPNVAAAKQELVQLREQKNKLGTGLANYVQDRSVFISKLHNELVGHLEEMHGIRNRVFNYLEERVKEVKKEEENILNDLKKLLDVGELKKE